MPKRDQALERAIKKAAAQKQGRQRSGIRVLADALGLTTAAVAAWSSVPIKHVLDVERLTGVSRRSLRPDYYPNR